MTKRSERNFAKNIAVCDEKALETYLEVGELPEKDVKRLIKERRVYPCYFGSALKVEGVKELLNDIEKYTVSSQMGTSVWGEGI